MIRVLGAAAAAALALTAVPAQGAAQKTVLKMSTAPGVSMKYSTKTLKAKAGVVTIVMKNTSILPHDVAIKGNGVHAKGKVVPKGGTSTVTAKLKRGRYEFYCTVPGHEAAGMKGTLTVT
jgi:plastocyanin